MENKNIKKYDLAISLMNSILFLCIFMVGYIFGAYNSISIFFIFLAGIFGWIIDNLVSKYIEEKTK